MFRCCYKCKKRHINCHSVCEDFLKEKAKLDKQREETAKEKAFRGDFIVMVTEKKYKQMRKRNLK